MRSFRFHSGALAEFEAAVLWYADRWHDAASRFALAVDSNLVEICELPDAWPFWPGRTDVRRRVMHRFPYSLVYLPRTEIIVIAVAHHKRRPGYWVSRLRAGPR